MMQFNSYTDYVNIDPLIKLFCNVGDGCKYIGYIDTGAFRFTHDGTDAKEHIISYAFENEFIGSYSSLQNQKRTLFTIQSIRESAVYRLPVIEINSFLGNSSEYHPLGKRIVEIILYLLAQQVISIYCNSPEEQYFR